MGRRKRRWLFRLLFLMQYIAATGEKEALEVFLLLKKRTRIILNPLNEDNLLLF
jgi:hypothetical protein